MKKILFIALMFISMAAAAQTDNGWEQWQQTSCYSKIWFRIKYVEKRGEQNVWLVQFKNEYPSVISFNYSITDKLQQYNLTTHRKSVNQKQMSTEVEVFTTEDDLFLIVDKVSLSPYPEDFIDCDQ
jgi:hypothetical protein